ncbi:MAG: pentapeptide repeat-containing protein [Planctomyces sp.]|nr:pentapeptide repeat-containing protein [Planctomyces sp.]
MPPLPDRRPQYDDEEPLGVTFFRTFVGEDGDEGDAQAGSCDLVRLKLPRTYFGKSGIQGVSFQNTDLSESTLCWNDFADVNFTDADLSGGDLRASLFENVRFARANLRNADLRRSSFVNCDFTDADMQGVRLTPAQAEDLRFSESQRQAIDWQDDDGEEPPGG